MIITRKSPRGLNRDELERFIVSAQRAIRLKGAVSVLITNSQEMRILNRRFRGKDKSTDVLSFPAMAVARRHAAGDLAISAEIAAENAAELGHSLADELKVLILHGVLHLAGYDHETDDGEMAGREIRLRKSLGLPISLIERSGMSRTPAKTVASPKQLSRGVPRQSRSRRRS